MYTGVQTQILFLKNYWICSSNI